MSSDPVKVKGRATSERLDAQSRVYREYEPLVRAVVIGRGVPGPVVEDVVHDAFLAIYRRFDVRPQTVHLRHWVASVARNVAFSHRRSTARRRFGLDQLFPAEASEPISTEFLDARRAWLVVSEFLDEIPVAQKEAFVLCQVLGLTMSEAARLQGCSPNTVSSRLRLARAKFAHAFPDAAGVGDHEALLRRAVQGSAPTRSRRRRNSKRRRRKVLPAETGVASILLPAVVWVAVGGLALATVSGIESLSFGSTEHRFAGSIVARCAPRAHDHSFSSDEQTPAAVHESS